MKNNPPNTNSIAPNSIFTFLKQNHIPKYEVIYHILWSIKHCHYTFNFNFNVSRPARHWNTCSDLQPNANKYKCKTLLRKNPGAFSFTCNKWIHISRTVGISLTVYMESAYWLFRNRNIGNQKSTQHHQHLRESIIYWLQSLIKAWPPCLSIHYFIIWKNCHHLIDAMWWYRWTENDRATCQ